MILVSHNPTPFFFSFLFFLSFFLSLWAKPRRSQKEALRCHFVVSHWYVVVAHQMSSLHVYRWSERPSIMKFSIVDLITAIVGKRRRAWNWFKAQNWCLIQDYRHVHQVSSFNNCGWSERSNTLYFWIVTSVVFLLTAIPIKSGRVCWWFKARTWSPGPGLYGRV